MSVKLKNGVRGIASLTAPTESISRHMPYGAAEAGLSGVERPPVRACTVCKEWAGHIPLPARDAGISNTIGKTAQERQRLAMTQGRLSAALTAHLRTESAGRTHQRALITLIGPLWPLDKQSRGFHTSRGCNRPGAGRPAGSQNADTAAMRSALSGLLEGQVHIAIVALADTAESGRSETARVSAACAILDRTHGRPRASPDAAPLHGLSEDP
jgi:hypothetical protein